MPPKKKEGGGAGGDAVEGEDPQVLLQNYQKFCKYVGVSVNTSITKTLNDEEHYPVEQFVIDDEFGILGPGGTRALMTSIMGIGPNMKGGAYKLLKSIRIWKSNIGDEGVNSICEVLRLGGADVRISYLELLDNNIGARGGIALGSALAQGNNISLLTLKLDYNSTLGTQGVANLCCGLRTNISLKQLHLQFCNMTSDAGPHLSDLVANSKSALELLNLSGNRLGGIGLSAICRGLAPNTKLTTLLLADNMIEQNEEDLVGITDFRDCLLIPTLGLANVDIMYNRIGVLGAELLLPALDPSNTRIKEFLIDLTIPLPLFEKIFRKGGGKKGKGKKGGGKKGKK